MELDKPTIVSLRNDFKNNISVKGTITSANDGGWLVDIGGFTAFLPKSQFKHSKASPDSYIGKEYSFKILDFICSGTYILSFTVSYFKEKLHSSKLGDNVKCIVKWYHSNGLFVEIKGVSSFIKLEELPATNRSELETLFPIGDVISAKIINLDFRHGIVEVSVNAYENERKKLFDGIQVNNLYPGVVRKIIPGSHAIVDLGGINAYIHISEIAKTFIDDINKHLVVGEEYIFAVLSKDVSKFKINLSLKQVKRIEHELRMMKEKAIKDQRIMRVKAIAERYNPGDVFEAKVTSITKLGVWVEIAEDVPGFIPNDELRWGYSNLATEAFIGEVRNVVFLEEKNGVFICSTKLLETDRYDSALYKKGTVDLLLELGIKNNSFIGKVIQSKVGSKLLINLYAALEEDDGKLLVDPITGVPINIVIPDNKAELFETNSYYNLHITASPSKIREEDRTPFRFMICGEDLVDVSKNKVEDPYKRLVDRSFYKHNSPSSNTSLANLLEEVGQNMYDSKDRMFFELLQNADDASAQQGVKVILQSVDGYLLLSHDGMPFDRKDYVSITSAARSTKGGKKAKTGYKGIGFKSVFTNSTKVYIKTGGLSFVFDKNAPIFSSFEEFYFKVNEISTPDMQKQFLEDNKEEREEFKGVDSIPWQLLPFWNQTIPAELQKTIFEMRSNVCIALAMTENNKSAYKDAILDVLGDPKFMLFLRNTNRIQYIEGDWEFNLAKKVIKGKTILQSTRPGNESIKNFIVKDGTTISIDENAFASVGVDIKITKVINPKTGKEESLFVDSNGQKIPSIPSRISGSSSTCISYAFSVGEGDVLLPIKSRHSMYAYLPMVETRFPFPIYINADFILKSNRQGIQSDNVWNHYLMYNIGRSYPSWIAQIASKSQPHYLSLLLDSFYDESDKDMTELASFFNRGYSEAIKTEAFILNDKEEIVCQDSIVIDDTKLASIIGVENFCHLTEQTERRLPHPQIDITILDSEIFANITHVSSVNEYLNDDKKKKYIRWWITNADASKRLLAYEWLKKQNDSELVKLMPVFLFGKKFRSFAEVQDASQFLFLDSSLLAVKDILSKIGFICTDGDIQSHPLYNAYLHDNILKGNLSKSLAAIILKSEQNESKLSIEDKVRLYQAVSQKCVSEKLRSDCSQWKLFRNSDNLPCRLGGMMTSGTDENENKLFSAFIVNKDDYELMSYNIRALLMSRDNIYECFIISNWESIINKWCEIGAEAQWNEEEYAKLYTIVQSHYKAYCSNNPTLKVQTISRQEGYRYILSGTEFISSEDGFYSPKFSSTTLRSAAEKMLDTSIPSTYALPYLAKEPFTTASKKWTTREIKEDPHLSQEELIAVLDFCKENNEDFFDKFIIVQENDEYVVKQKDGKWQFVTDDSLFAQYILEVFDDAIWLPTVFNTYKSNDSLVKDEALYKKLFKSVKCLEAGSRLLNFVNSQSDKIKKEYINSLGEIVLSKSFFEENTYYAALFGMCSNLFVISDETDKPNFIPLRSSIKIEYTDNNLQQQKALNEIPLQGKVLIGSHSFDMDDLNPSGLQSFQKAARNVLSAMRAVGIKEEYLNALFDLESEIKPGDVFNSLNDNCPLENGAQLAFVLRYMSTNTVSNIKFSLEAIDGKKYHGSVVKQWYISSYPFILEKRILAVKYQDITNYISEEEFEKLPNGFKIIKSADKFEYVKSEFNPEEIQSLLDYMFGKYEEDTSYWSTNLSVESLLSKLTISRDSIVVSQSYSLADEGLPTDIITWVRSEDDLDKQNSRLEFIQNVFSLNGEESDIVKFRKYLNGESATFNIEDVTSLFQTKACNWIRQQKVWLTESQYDWISTHIDRTNIHDTVDVDIINNQIQGVEAALQVNNFHVYKYDGIIPRRVYVVSDPNYVCYKYQSGDYFVDGYRIIVSTNSWNSLEHILMTIASDSNTGFTSTDFLKYMQQRGAMGGYSVEEKDILEEQLESTNNELRRLREIISNMNVDMASIDDSYRDLDPDRKKEALLEARRAVCEHLRKEGFEVSEVENNSDDWTRISGVRKGAEEYTVIVRSYRDSETRNFELNPFDWVNLMKGNTMLWVYTKRGPECFPFKDLVKNKSRISLSFSTVNTDYVARMNALAESLRYFNSVRFDFGPNLSRGHSTAERFLKPEQKLDENLSADATEGMF